MNLKRRELFRLAVLLLSPVQPFPLFGQAKPRESLHPPEPDEFDALYLRQKSRNQPAMQLHGRGQEFSNCLQRLFDTTARLYESVGRMPVAEVFSVQVYKQTELIERLAKQLKALAKN